MNTYFTATYGRKLLVNQYYFLIRIAIEIFSTLLILCSIVLNNQI